jgi:hypothetical protein
MLLEGPGDSKPRGNERSFDSAGVLTSSGRLRPVVTKFTTGVHEDATVESSVCGPLGSSGVVAT